MAYTFNPFTGTLDKTNGGVPDPLTLQSLTVTGLLEANHIHGNIAGTVYIHIKNLDNVPLTKGTPFYISGTVGASDRVEVKAADASDPSKGPAVGLIEETLDVNGEGNGVLLGEIFQYNTLDAGWATNDALYVATGGGLTNTQPTSGFRQVVGYAGRIHDETGTIVVVSNAADPVAGSNTQIQFNDNGGFGASADLTWDDGTKELSVNGNLTVTGTTTTIESQTLTVEDKNIEMGVVDTPSDTTADGGGITLKGATDKTINWVNATDAWTSSEPLDLPAGSDSAPSLFFNGDVDTGIYSPGADQLAISTNGTGRLFIDASGNVGINTAAGSATGFSNGVIKSKAIAGAPGLFLESSNSNSWWGVYGGTGLPDSAAVVYPNGGSLRIATTTEASVASFSEKLRITSDGKVGLGTSLPFAPLHLVGIDANNTYNATTDSFLITAGGGQNLRLYVDQTNRKAAIQSVEIGTGGKDLLLNPAGGNVGIGTTSPTQKLQITDGSLSNFYIAPGYNGGTGTTIGVGGGEYLAFNGAPFTTERMRIDSSGRLLIGTSSALQIGSTVSAIQVRGTGPDDSGLSISRFSDNLASGYLSIGKARGSIATPVIVNDDDIIGTIQFAAYDGANLTTEAAQITAEVDGTPGVDDMPGRLVFSTTADGASSPTERMRIDSNGLITTTGSTTQGDEIFQFQGGSVGALRVFKVNSVGNSTTEAAVWIRKNSSTDRSINAAGTVNASGADYAEYMTKAGDFTIAKGDICGIDPNGKLTNVFANAVGFVVKSTDPSYVGSDSWGADIEDPVQLETERQKVDRIAFAGQVPVNVIGAIPGQYIIPVEDNGGISGIAKYEADLTLAEYIRAVGKVIAIEDDGRARIIVKVA